MRPIRSLLFAAYFYAVTLVFGLAGVLVRALRPSAALSLARIWAGVALAGLEPICGIRVRVTGLHHLPAEGPALLAAQHQSAFDTLVWMRHLRRPSYVLKQELTRVPLFGRMLVPAGMIPVDRRGGAAALRRLLEAAEAARRDGRQMVIFPEGTRVAPGERARLHAGIAAIAARTGLPVLPVATDSGCFWRRGVLGKFAGTLNVAIGPPIAAGPRREALLAAIETFWRESEQRGFVPVDKAVEQAAAPPPPDRAARG